MGSEEEAATLGGGPTPPRTLKLIVDEQTTAERLKSIAIIGHL